MTRTLELSQNQLIEHIFFLEMPLRLRGDSSLWIRHLNAQCLCLCDNFDSFS